MNSKSYIINNKELMAEWDYESNNKAGLDPTKLTKGSQKKARWKCRECGYSWACSIDKKIKNSKCPKCNNTKLIVGFNDLKTKFPEIAEDWDYDKNADKMPEQFRINSHYNAFWKCHKCGYRWQTKIQTRTSGHSNCHKCNNYALISGVNDLETLYPEIAKDWDYERNGNLTPRDIKPGRKYKVAWKCHICGHRWEITPNNRTANKSGCPKCFMAQQTSFPEQALFYYVKQLYPDAINRYKAGFLEKMELDIYIPSIRYAIEYDGAHWHLDCKIDLERKKYKLCATNNITLLRIRENMSPLGSDNADYIIGTVKIDNKDNLEHTIINVINFINFSRKKVDINLSRDEKFIRSQYQGKHKKSLAILYPNLLKEWDYESNGDLTPDKISISSLYKAYWICPECGYKYQSTVANRTLRHSGCKKCAYKKLAMLKSKSVSKIELQTNKVIEIYASISEASRKNKICSNCILRVCKGERKQTGGYGWCYVDTLK